MLTKIRKHQVICHIKLDVPLFVITYLDIIWNSYAVSMTTAHLPNLASGRFVLLRSLAFHWYQICPYSMISARIHYTHGPFRIDALQLEHLWRKAVRWPTNVLELTLRWPSGDISMSHLTVLEIWCAYLNLGLCTYIIIVCGFQCNRFD